MQKWEYKTLRVTGDGNKLFIDGHEIATSQPVNALPYIQQFGEDGWEMVAATSESVSKCVGGSAWSSEVWGGIRWYFKRPKD